MLTKGGYAYSLRALLEKSRAEEEARAQFRARWTAILNRLDFILKRRGRASAS